jgi:hypothetical protein
VQGDQGVGAAAAAAGAGPGAATNRFQFREEGAEGDGRGFLEWGASDSAALRKKTLQQRKERKGWIGCWVEVGAASTSTTGQRSMPMPAVTIHYRRLVIMLLINNDR